MRKSAKLRASDPKPAKSRPKMKGRGDGPKDVSRPKKKK